jgi:hypothetical protein
MMAKEELLKNIEAKVEFITGYCCKDCDGGGWDYDSNRACSRCNGNGIYGWQYKFFIDEVASLLEQYGVQENNPMNDEQLLAMIVELMSVHSIHPQETHVDGCSYEEDDTTCDCSYSFEFKQFPRWKEEVAQLIKSHTQQIALESRSEGWIGGSAFELGELINDAAYAGRKTVDVEAIKKRLATLKSQQPQEKGQE